MASPVTHSRGHLHAERVLADDRTQYAVIWTSHDVDSTEIDSDLLIIDVAELDALIELVSVIKLDKPGRYSHMRPVETNEPTEPPAAAKPKFIRFEKLICPSTICFTLKIWSLYFTIGWYNNEPYRVASIEMLEFGLPTMLVILKAQVARLGLLIYYTKGY